jgi:hypothetical protein
MVRRRAILVVVVDGPRIIKGRFHRKGAAGSARLVVDASGPNADCEIYSHAEFARNWRDFPLVTTL